MGGVGTVDYNTHIMAYSVTGEFNPMIMPEVLFRKKIELRLNKASFKYAWSDKNYFEMFFPEARFPVTIARNINGIYYDKDYNIISENIVCEKLKNFSEYIVKPSTDSGFARGLQLHTDKEKAQDVLRLHKKDFIIQEKFIQHETIRKFNPSSVNVVRYNTAIINGKVRPLTALLRVGAEGAINDASVTDDGRGMFFIGIDKNGCLKDRAYHLCGIRLDKCPNGEEFCGVQVPGFDKMTEIATKMHEKLGYFGFIGWDFVVDEDGNPVVMEYNLKSPGSLPSQYANGPLFGEYTQELIDSFKK